MTRDDARLIQQLLKYTVPLMPPPDFDEDARAARDAAAKLAQTSFVILGQGNRISESALRDQWGKGATTDTDDPFGDGMKAFHDGAAEEENPFDETSDDHARWNDGWQSAYMETEASA